MSQPIINWVNTHAKHLIPEGSRANWQGPELVYLSEHDAPGDQPAGVDILGGPIGNDAYVEAQVVATAVKRLLCSRVKRTLVSPTKIDIS